MKWIWCCVGLGLYSLWVCACVVDGKEGERVIDSGWWYNGRESWKERDGKREMNGKEGGKVIWGKRASFCFLCDRVFHTIISRPSIRHTTPHIPTLTLHTTPSHTQHATQACLCAVLFLSLCVAVSALNLHSAKQHNTMQSFNHHTWHNQWMMQWVNGKGQWWLRTPHHKHQAPQWSDDGTHFTWSHWLHGLGMHTHHNTTRTIVRRSDKKKEVVGERGLAQEKKCHFCVLVWHHKNHLPLVWKPKRRSREKEKRNCYGHTKRKAPLLVWSVKLSLFGPG